MQCNDGEMLVVDSSEVFIYLQMQRNAGETDEAVSAAHTLAAPPEMNTPTFWRFSYFQ